MEEGDEGGVEYGSAVCDVDGEVTATVWCNDCSKLLCAGCDATTHSESSGLQDHARDPLGEEEVIEEQEGDVEHVIEMQEEEVLKWLDKEQDPYTVCSKLFKVQLSAEPIEWPALKKLPTSNAKELLMNSYTIIDNFFETDLVREVREEALRMVEKGLLTPPRSKNDDSFRDHTARGDITTWLHKGQTEGIAPCIAEAMKGFAVLQADLASIVDLLHDEGEHQLAYYAGNGAHYERHRDALPDDGSGKMGDQRRVTAILYCNTEWKKGDGGELRLFLGEEQRDIEPLAGRVLIFLSGVVDHEVLPSNNHRFALTAWFS